MEQNIICDTNQDDRIIYLSNTISDQNISDVCKQILSINELDQKNTEKFRVYELKPIQLHIQSFGGSIYDMWALIDVISSSTTPIVTYCTGYCMSAAALIFIAGHYRCMYPNSYIMFHQLSTFNFGKIGDVEIDFKQSEKLHKQIIKFIKKNTKLKDSFYKKFDSGKEDIFLDAKKCLKNGVCDNIVETIDWRDTLKKQIDGEPKE